MRLFCGMVGDCNICLLHGGKVVRCLPSPAGEGFGFAHSACFTHQIPFAIIVTTGRRGRRPLPCLCKTLHPTDTRPCRAIEKCYTFHDARISGRYSVFGLEGNSLPRRWVSKPIKKSFGQAFSKACGSRAELLSTATVVEISLTALPIFLAVSEAIMAISPHSAEASSPAFAQT